MEDLKQDLNKLDLSYLGCLRIIFKTVINLQTRAKILAYLSHPEMKHSDIEALLYNIKKTPTTDDFSHNSLALAITHMHGKCIDDAIAQKIYALLYDMINKRVVFATQPIFQQIMEFYSNPAKSAALRKAHRQDLSLDNIVDA